LTEQLATRRANQLKFGKLFYELHLNLNRGPKYNGTVIARFTLQHVDEDLFIDFSGTDIVEVSINGKSSYEKGLWNKLFLILPKEKLVRGPNVVRITFNNEYVRNGNGLHSFTDTDGKQYLYSQCEPYYCRMIFPK
jgi:aminopeptidase N